MFCEKCATLGYIVSGLILLCSMFYIYAKYKLSYWSKRGVKTPPTHFLFGNMKESMTFRKPLGLLFHEIYESANHDDPYIAFYILHKPVLLLRDLHLIKQVMVSEFENFSDRRFGGTNQKDSLGFTNLLTIKQPRWKYLRQKLTPSVTGHKLRRLTELMKNSGNPMLKFIDDEPADKSGWKTFEVKDLAFRYTNDVIASTVFGIGTNSFNKYDTAFVEAGKAIFLGVKRGIIMMILFILPAWGRFIEPFTLAPARFFRRIFWDSMSSREKDGNARGDLIDYFLSLKNGEQWPGLKFDDENLLGQAVSFYVAGLEATSSAIAFSLYELSRNPEHQERLYQEIMDTIAEGELDFVSINKMEFMEKVVNETLRMYPPLSLLDRIPLKDYKFPGTDLVLEKDVPVYIAVNGINRDSRYYNEPNVFNPERENPDIPNASMAFGIGPRSCVGQRLGKTITKIALISILKEFTLSSTTDGSYILDPIGVFTSTVNGVHVKLRRRNL